jgi:hypothetical protein
VDATSVYWTDEGTVNTSNGAVMKVPVGGGTPTALASATQTLPLRPYAITVDSTSVYWTDLDLGSLMKLTLK